ncbi:hypothetical protein NEICINOT_03967 [Neisseria cinerea ATCC 14685]|uniref:Uncharacterized protein n=1 Tax=Neisseria cinerea ATCC 14685 TaxID=546262 RepID=D0W2T3_NEICI|nr:hypothetical protein NEICINOT_03967 [Neisseria cinerea ATCC 14685]
MGRFLSATVRILLAKWAKVFSVSENTYLKSINCFLENAR